MSLKIVKVNAAGMASIKQFLLENHKHPQEATTDEALAKCASFAEVYADVNDGEVIVDIAEADCVHGHAMALTLGEADLDVDVFSEQC